MYGREGKDLTLTAAGDAIINRRISTCEENRVQELVDIIRDADLGFVNLETLLHDFEFYPNAECGGTYLRSPRYIADELRWMGFDLFAAANNHTGDYSHGGMISTMEALEERNMTYAGLGRNLGEARSPSYLDTPGGNVALVAACSHFPTSCEAGEQRPDIQGRPGLSPLKLNAKFTVTEEWHENIKELSKLLGLEKVKEEDYRKKGLIVPEEDEENFVLLNPKGDNLTFEKGEKFKIHYEMNERDRQSIIKEIDRANKQADWVLVSLHYHTGQNGRINDQSIPEFVKSFAHECVDNGADALLCHGPHVLRGVEIYQEKPIFYSLGNFFFQVGTLEKLPADMYQDLERYSREGKPLGPDNVPSDVYDIKESDEKGNPRGFLSSEMYWETILPVIKFKEGRLKEIDLYPVDLGREEPRSRRGRPLIRKDEKGISILEQIRDLSQEFNTDIKVEEEKAIIEA
ncbi:MAG: CapA family protein [Candidatus Acetothermia bacterium]